MYHFVLQVKPLLELVPDAKYPLELVEADLNDKDCWGPAVDGCSYIFQVASHAPPEGSVDEDNLIAQELEGVVNVLVWEVTQDDLMSMNTPKTTGLMKSLALHSRRVS